MAGKRRASEIFLIAGFIAIIFAVPTGQVCIELGRGGRAQFADLFRYGPSEGNLRQFEKALEEQSWFRQKLRPEMQARLFATFRDAGHQAVLGREGWMFYKPDVRLLIEPDRPEKGPTGSVWVERRGLTTKRESVLKTIVNFHDRLAERGVKLLVVPVPGKPSVYPDMLTRRARDFTAFRSPTESLIEEFEKRGVEAVNLFDLFRKRRASSRSEAYYLARDTHWTPKGAKLAALTVAARLKSLGWAPEPSRKYEVARTAVARRSDIIEMFHVPELHNAYPPEVVECEIVRDSSLGPLVPAGSTLAGTYMDPERATPILVLGDSFLRIYQTPEPKSLGEGVGHKGAGGDLKEGGTKRLLPGSAGFISHLALSLGGPVDYIVSDGGASADVRMKLSANAEILDGKKVVIWEFAERDIMLGEDGWRDTPLPRKLSQEY
ncbi:hypothetical protein ACFL1X_05995 [Candidatus Hydrogenedentota bacterium]